MDPKRFDDLTRALASGISRRRFIAMIAGAVAGSALGGIWPGRAVLAVDSPCRACTVPGHYACENQLFTDIVRCSQCCGDPNNSCGIPVPRACFCQVCGSACPPGETDCNGICCHSDEVCNGTLGCGPACPEGFSPCGTGCCAPDFVCVAGKCASCACPPVKPYCVGASGQQCSWLDQPSRQEMSNLLDVVGLFGTLLGVLSPTLYVKIITAVLKALVRDLRFSLTDPPDTNFTVIAQPVTPSLSRQPVTATQAGGQRQADAINAALTNAEQALGFARVLLTSNQRAWGAFNAGDTFWETQQSNAARQYTTQLAALLNTEPQLLAGVRDALQVAGVQETITASDIADFQVQIRQDGLPSQLVQDLTDLGVDLTAQDEIRQDILGENPTVVAGLGGGNALLTLTDPVVVQAFLGVARTVNQFAGGSSLTKATTLTYTGDTSGDFRDQVTLAATLLDASSSTAVPISGAMLSLALGSQSCTAATDGTGQGMCIITPTLNTGSWPATATFAGGAPDMPSFAFADFRVTKNFYVKPPRGNQKTRGER